MSYLENANYHFRFKVENHMQPWEPVDELMYLACDHQAEPMEAEPDPDCPQTYYSTLIGFNLDDAYGRSVAEVITGEGREVDEALAKAIVESIQKASQPQSSAPNDLLTCGPREQFELLVVQLGNVHEWSSSEKSTYYSFFLHGWFGRAGKATYQQSAIKEIDNAKPL
jgi:hypothetical protein